MKIVIDELELDFAQARKVWEELNKLFGERSGYYPFYVLPYKYEPYPIFPNPTPYPPWVVTCNTSGAVDHE